MKTLSFFKTQSKFKKSTNRKVAKVIFCSDQPKEGRLQDVEASPSRFSGLDGELHQGHLHLRGPVRQQARLAQGAETGAKSGWCGEQGISLIHRDDIYQWAGMEKAREQIKLVFMLQYLFLL
jgi:hypothetical protein